MDMHFSREYEKAVEEKQIAQQTAERAKFMVDRAIQEKKSTIIKAEADVQAIQLIGAVVKDNPAYLQLQQIELAKNISEILSKSKNRTMLNSDMLMLNLQNLSDDSLHQVKG